MTEQKQSKSYPLTSPQRQIWFDQQLHPDVPLYNVGGYVQINGAIDPSLFEKAINLLVQRHEALRTVLVPGAPVPTQTFRLNLPVTVPFYDFSGKNNPHQTALDWMQAQFVLPFELDEKPLFRFALLKISDLSYYWLGWFHHLIADGWSFSLITQSVAKIYTQLIQGQQIEPVAPSYLAFVLRDRAYIESERYEVHRQYWIEKYRTLPEQLFAPRYLSQFVEQTPPSERRVLSLARPFYNQLIALSKRCDATTFHLILGALYVYLTRTGQHEELVVGLPVLNRPSASFKNTIGLFVGVSAARFAFGTEIGFKTLLQAIGRELKHNYRYQRFPISELNREVGLHKLGRQQLFDLSVSYEKHDYDALFGSYKAQATTLVHGYEQTPLMIYVREFHDDEDVDIDLVYNLAYFDAAEIERLQSRFLLILEYVLNHVDDSIRTIPLLTEAEQQQLIAWNQTQADYPLDKTIVDLFQEQVEKTPSNLAVVFEGQKLTYQALNFKANQLAHYLIEQGVQAETLVGICVERSIDLVIGLLGILKAGGAYVPLDQDYPTPRLQFLLEDSQVPVLLTQTHLIERLPALQAKVVGLDREWATIAAYSDENPVRLCCPENLAYVIYTSGSTGKPKGVMIEHVSLLNHMLWMQKTFAFSTAEKILQKTPFSFDASVWEFYAPLLVGGMLVMAKPDGHIDSDYLAQTVQQHQITVLQLVPSLFKMLLDEAAFQTEVPLRYLFCGGETFWYELCQNFYQLQKTTQLYNLYGPTETTIDASYWHCDSRAIAIGHPIANTQIYILDAHHSPTPIGIQGELCIAGRGLARGYLNRPELTLSKFIEVDIFGEPKRLYKTGDLARWRSDGNLEYLGRLDYQVKLRGFRIELGEIEATLTQHDAVTEAVVVLIKDEDNPRLAAYVTLATPRDDIASLLRTWLKARLPEYMLPASFTVLEKLPLTPNGKIDRNALPAPELAQPDVVVEPQSDFERLLAQIWSEVLGYDITNTQTDFFEAGGHSLLATQLVSRIRERFAVEMPLKKVFEHARLQEQADWLAHQQRGTLLPPLTPLAEGEPLVLSFAQLRLWFLAQLDGPSATYNMPATLRLQGELSKDALQQTFISLIEHHLNLRLCFPEVDGQATVQVLAVYNPVRLIDLSALPNNGQQQRVANHLIEVFANAPFDLTTGPLMRVKLLKLKTQEHLLLFNMHHIISDGWSISVMVRQWAERYEAYRKNRAPELPARSIQYTDYAAWQRNWLKGELLERQLSYWKEQLAGAPALLELPTDYPRPAVMSYQGAQLQTRLPAGLTQRLKSFSLSNGVTLYMSLLTAFQILLSRYSGQTDILVGSPIANRTHRQTEDLIGFFVNTLVLRTPVLGTVPVSQLLKQVRQTALQAYAHQDIPFEYLVEQLNPTRSLSHSPLFQVMLVLQNAPQEQLVIKGLKVSVEDTETTIAKFDLTLSIAEHEEVLVCDWEYRTDLFRPQTVKRMTEHFEVLLEGLINQPTQTVGQLPLLTEAEQQQLIAWNQTQTDYPVNKTIVDLFQEQVEKTPSNLAVVFEGQSLAYQALNFKANQLAHYLIEQRVEAETLVGICVERSIDLAIGLLGILKAGGAYVPLDPDYPAPRLQFLLEDSQVPVLLTQSHLIERLPASQAKFVALDRDWATIAAYPGENPLRQSGSDNLVYVIYTSGSTGNPKGVMIEHRAIVQHIHNSIQSYQIQSSDQVLQFASLNFDASIEQIFTAWCSGARLVLLSTNRLPTEALSILIEKQSLTLVDLPPAYWQRLLNEGVQTPSLASLKLLILGGEVLSSQLAYQTRQTLSNRVLNAYGPTEATITASLFEIPSSEQSTSATANTPIGQPIANTQIYLLDALNNPTPIGIPGELCIAGKGLARGYLNRPDLTLEKFIEVDIFGESKRLYKTGDLARWREDGNLEYLGRLDYQVKLRGFRIELGEIEATLTQHEAVREAVVVLIKEEGNPRLAAYVTLATPIDDTASLLRTWLKARLPEYMLPASFTVLDKLPLTPNGKIDRKALEQLSVNREQLSRKEFIAPRTPEEELLAGIWSRVLGRDKIGIHDNFFELGGHSLQAVQLLSKIALATNINIPVKQLFLYPTIAELATLLDKPELKRKSEHSPSTSQLENLPISKGDLIVSQSSPYFQLERRSLLSLLSAKKIQPVNAAALGYLPNAILEQTDLSREELLEQWFDNLPVIDSIIDTAWGRIAGLLLPRFNSELYGETDEIVNVILEALEIAGQIGADTVSLTGMIPSATDYGRAIVKVMAERRHLPQITTGHSTTSATVVLAIQKMLQQAGRAMTTEQVGVIGLGSIGFSSLCLMLKCLPHPVELMLCDLYSKKAFLEEIRDKLVSELGFHGKIQLLFSELELPQEIYNATLIVGATNVPDVLDISQVKPGTLIVDDSGPHCFKSELAIKRFQEHQDILFTEGGVLKSPQPISKVEYLPHHVEKHLKIKREELVKHNPFEITGCVFSSVLSSSFKNFKPSVGFVQLNDSLKHYDTLISLGFQAADLHCENYVLPFDAISHFRERFAH
jgi:amino acid adenylation domain-containing protein